MAFSSRRTLRDTFPDHTGNDVISTSFERTHDVIPPSFTASRKSSASSLESPSPQALPLLIYIHPSVLASDLSDIPTYFQSLAASISSRPELKQAPFLQTDLDISYQVVISPQADVFACVEHYRREKDHRARHSDSTIDSSIHKHRQIPHTYARQGLQTPPRSSFSSGSSSSTSLSSYSSSLCSSSSAPSGICSAAHSNLLFYLDRPDWRTTGPVLVSWGLANFSRCQVDACSSEDLIAAQTAINRGRVKLRAKRIAVEDVGECLHSIWASSGGDGWAGLEEEEKVQKEMFREREEGIPSSPEEEDQDQGQGHCRYPERRMRTSHDHHEADPRHFLQLAQPLETLLQLTTPATSKSHPILRQNAVPGSTIPSLTVWSSRHGTRMPDFSFVLYLPGEKTTHQQDSHHSSSSEDDDDLDNLLPEDLSLRLFRALDLGILQSVPWRLDVFSHAPTLHHAVNHYREERALRMYTAASPNDLTASTRRQDIPPPLDYARSPYLRFRSVLLLADNTTEITSHMSLLMFDPVASLDTTPTEHTEKYRDDDDEPPHSDDTDDASSDTDEEIHLSSPSSRDLISLVKFRLGCSGLPCDSRRPLGQAETPRLSRVLFALWDICHSSGINKRPGTRSVNELLWF